MKLFHIMKKDGEIITMTACKMTQDKMNLKQIRTTKNQTQLATAQALGVCLNTYKNWETGKIELKGYKLAAVVRVLNGMKVRR